MMMMQRKLTFFTCIIIFITCLVMNKITFFPKYNTHSSGILKDCTQASISSNPSLMVHSDDNSHSGNVPLHEKKISPMGVNHHNTNSKDVNSHYEEVKEVNNFNNDNIISKSDVPEQCNDSMCLNYLSGEVKKNYNSCQKKYEEYKKRSKVKRISNVSESCHFRDGKGQLIVRVKGNVVGRIKMNNI